MIVEQEERTLQVTSNRPEVAATFEPVFIGRSHAIGELKTKIDLIADSQAPVLITGESGTGKEIVARLIHCRSAHPTNPFVAINAAALPKDVVDNELFGHEKEAFTGAVSKKMGCFEHANHGTLFLDEIAEMHPQTQAKLLRAIENKTFRRLGGKEEVAVDVHILAATNRDVPAALKSGDLRVDLYYRLSVIEIAIPPLRERREDVPLLADYFMTLLSKKYNKRKKSFTKETIEMLMAFDWPGNVRELRNLMERLMIVCPDDEIHPRHLSGRVPVQEFQSTFVSIPIGTPLEEAEKIIIDGTLSSVGSNKSAAARLLGISRKTLHNKLKLSHRKSSSTKPPSKLDI